MKSILKLPQVVRFIWRHPLSRKRRMARLRRFVGWQVGSRLVPGPVIVPFVEGTRLIVRPGMHGATGNVYTGLHEFNEMAFVLHCLRKDDLFVDVGANVGTYTLLAAGVVGCRCIAMEPVGSSYEQLVDNLRFNQALHLVDVHRVAVGDECGSVRITNTLDTLNRVVDPHAVTNNVPSNEVAMRTLDELVAGKAPTIIKIDVEGFEPRVVMGAMRTLRQSSVLAVLMETNRNAGRDEDRDWVNEQLETMGYRRYRYHGLSRRLEGVEDADRKAANVIFARSVEPLLERIQTARRFRVLDTEL